MTIQDAWSLIQTYSPLLATLFGAAMLYLGTKFVRHKRCKEHRDTMRQGFQADCGDHETRIAALEERHEDAINALNIAVTEVQGGQDALAAEIRGVKDLVTQMNAQQAQILSCLLPVGRA